MAAYSSSVSASSASAFGASRSSRIAAGQEDQAGHHLDEPRAAAGSPARRPCTAIAVWTRNARPTPTQTAQGLVAGGQHQRGDEGLVGELDQEDRPERDRDDGEIHPAEPIGRVRDVPRSPATRCHCRRTGVESDSGVDRHIPRGAAMATFEHYDQGTPSWVELTTPDQGAAREFYGGLFGWAFNDNDMGEMGHYYIATVEGDESPGSAGRCPAWRATPRSGASTSPSTTSTRRPPRSRRPAARSRRARST